MTFFTSYSQFNSLNKLSPSLYNVKALSYWRFLASYSIENDIQVQVIGLPAARQALLLAEDDPVAVDLLGSAYMILENPIVAERFFIQALEMDAEFAPAHLHLGMLYLSQGKTHRARDHLEQVVRLDPASPAGVRASEMLVRFLP